MALKTSGTVLILVPGHGTIKITRQRFGKLAIRAPKSLAVLDRDGKPFGRKKPEIGGR